MNTSNISGREKEVLTLIAYEHSSREIAKELYISEHTVISHRKNLLVKMDVKNTAGLVRRAFEVGILNLKVLSIILISFSYIQICAQHTNQQLPFSINTDGDEPDASAILDIASTDKGILIPRMTSAQRIAILGTTGLLLYDTTTDSFWYYDGSSWQELGQGVGSGGAFEIVDRVVRSTGDHTEDFVFGRDSLPANGELVQDTFFFFDKSKGAFRGGSLIGTDYWSTDFLGLYSFAFGFNVKASGLRSAAIGFNTTASGENSTAMGAGTKASGNDATAMGAGTEASGPNSTAMGQGTEASGWNSTAMGNSTIASDHHTTAMGSNTIASGLHSTAMGHDTEAIGADAIAMGDNTIASGGNATAMGHDTEATGGDATAMGEGTVASGPNSTAMGLGTEASGSDATAMGDNTIASGENTTAMGHDTEAIGADAIAMGDNTIASGDNATAMGHDTEAAGDDATAMGYNTVASGSNATSMGFNTEASGDDATSIGNGTRATGHNSTAVGNSTMAIGDYSTSLGFGTTSNTDGGLVLGRYNDTIVSAGYNIADDSPLFIIGNGDDGAPSNAIVVRKDGRIHAEGSSFIYGRHDLPKNGENISDNFFFFDVDRAAFRAGRQFQSSNWSQESLGLYSTVLGFNGLATGSQSTAIGWNTAARGQASIALGRDTKANGFVATAMGDNTDASGASSTAMGHDTKAIGEDATTMGFNTTANADGSLVLGRYNDTIVSAGYNIKEDSPLFIIGNGDLGAPSNAMVVRKSGLVEIPDSLIVEDYLQVGSGLDSRIIIGNDYIRDGGASILRVEANFTPDTNDAYNLGGGSFRWKTVFATNGTINTSDLRAKKNVNSLDYGLEDILQLNPVQYNWNQETDTADQSIGLIAQEILEVIPEVVHVPEDSNELMGVNYAELVPVLIKAIQEQQEQINHLTSLIQKK